MPLLVILISCGFWLFEPLSNEWFAYDRNLIKVGQWWRIISGHFLHTNTNHLLLNIAGLTLLWALHGSYYSIRSIVQILLLTVGTSAGIYFGSQELISYVGLSGILHGLFITGGYKDIKHKIFSGWILLAAVWAKVIYEQIIGPSQEVENLIGAKVAIDAHLYGVITGSVIVFYFVIRTHFSKAKFIP